MGITIRAAAESDYPAVARIQACSPEAAQWPLGDYSSFNLLIALSNGVPSGFCAWRQTVADEAELLNLAVDPGMRKQGLALALLAELRKAASGEIFLEVEEVNLAARALYRKAGWDEISARKDYYGQGRNAIVMKISSCYSSS